MVHEISVELVCPDVEVLTDADELVSLPQFIAAQVKSPNYIVGDFINVTETGIQFSARYINTTSRAAISELVASLKPYCEAGRVMAHVCRHDTKESCDAGQLIDEWGAM